MTGITPPNLHNDSMERLMIYRWTSALFAHELNQEGIAFFTSGAGGDLLRHFETIEKLKEDAHFMRDLLENHPDKRDLELELAAEYGRLFHGAGGLNAAPPYESVYTSKGQAMCQEAEQQVRKLMEKHGLSVADNFSEPADHIAIEMEFMAYLAGLTANEAHDPARVKELLKEQHLFLTGHLLNWLPRFAKGCENAGQTGFYAAVARLGLNLITEDRHYTSGYTSL